MCVCHNITRKEKGPTSGRNRESIPEAEGEEGGAGAPPLSVETSFAEDAVVNEDPAHHLILFAEVKVVGKAVVNDCHNRGYVEVVLRSTTLDPWVTVLLELNRGHGCHVWLLSSPLAFVLADNREVTALGVVLRGWA